jgi:methionyl-tRNA synthetase
MAQAERITTAIRELMSRERPPKSTSPVRAAHTEFVAALAANAPRPLHSEPNSEDLEGLAEHLEKVFAALHVYLTAFIAETAQDIAASTLDRRDLDGLFQQFSADALGAMRDAAAEMRGRENWRVS